MSRKSLLKKTPEDCTTKIPMLHRKIILALMTKKGKITRNQKQVLKVPTFFFYPESYSSPEQIKIILIPWAENDILPTYANNK